MDDLDRLRALAGDWQGTNAVLLPGAAPHEAATALAVSTVVAGSFVQLAYSWAFDGAPQEGLLLVGGDPAQTTLVGVWLDSWHMAHAVMQLAGEAAIDGVVALRGRYSVPESADWGWRIELEPGAAQLALRMYNIAPDGAEELGVEAAYSRA
jgi:hypothetical protein